MNDVEDLVKTYLLIRAERETLRTTYEAQDNVLKEEVGILEAHLLSVCNDTNTNGLKTTYGTVTRSVKERFYCTDWTNFKDFVEQKGSIDLLERRIHQKNFKDFMTERQSDGLPPGINVLREFDIVVRKSSTPVNT
mgnify:CR=1 FL=1|jgi:hypothetical protein